MFSFFQSSWEFLTVIQRSLVHTAHRTQYTYICITYNHVFNASEDWGYLLFSAVHFLSVSTVPTANKLQLHAFHTYIWINWSIRNGAAIVYIYMYICWQYLLLDNLFSHAFLDPGVRWREWERKYFKMQLNLCRTLAHAHAHANKHTFCSRQISVISGIVQCTNVWVRARARAHTRWRQTKPFSKSITRKIHKFVHIF